MLIRRVMLALQLLPRRVVGGTIPGVSKTGYGGGSRDESARWQRVVPLIVGAVVVAAFVMSEVAYFGRLGLPLDDSWIHLQFARNLAAGNGLSYNPGELVAGTTAPLWTAALSLLALLPGNPVVWSKLLGVVFFLANLVVVRKLSLALGLGHLWATLAAGLTATTGWLVWSALSAMEVSLFIFLGLSGMLLHIEERRDSARMPMSLAVFGVAALVRPEGLLLIVLALFDRLVLPTRLEGGGLALERPGIVSTWWGAVAATLAVAPAVLFNLAIGGSPFPTTLGAKSSGFQGVLPDMKSVFITVELFFREYPLLTLAALAGCLVLLERLGRKDSPGLLPALWLVGLPLAFSTLGKPYDRVLMGNFGRYFFPLFPLVIVLGLVGLERASREIGWNVRAGRIRIPVGLLLVLVLAWPAYGSVKRGLGRYLQNIENVENSDVAVAHWLAERLDPEAVLAVNDVGALKYLLPNRVVDLAGIINPELNEYRSQATAEGRDWHEGVLRLLEETTPDYLVVFPGWFPRLAALDERYRPVFGLDIPRNITMGGDQIAVFTTPWTRYPLAEPGDLPAGSAER